MIYIYLFMILFVAFQGLSGNIELSTNLTLVSRLAFVVNSYMICQIFCNLEPFSTVLMWADELLWFMESLSVPFKCSKIWEMSSISAVRVLTDWCFPNTMLLIKVDFPIAIVLTTPCTSCFCAQAPVLLEMNNFVVVVEGLLAVIALLTFWAFYLFSCVHS